MIKSKSLTIAYLIILAVSIIVDLVVKNDSTSRIATGATAAGFFFSISDLCGWNAEYKDYLVDKIDKYIKSAKKSCVMETIYIDSRIQDCNDAKNTLELVPKKYFPKERSDRIDSDIDYYNSRRAEIHNLEVEIATETQKIECIKKSLDHFHTTETLLAIAAFVIFFLITIYKNVFDFIVNWQTLLTIATFLVIILCYFLKESSVQRYAKESSLFDEKKERYDQYIGFIEEKDRYPTHTEWANQYVEIYKDVDKNGGNNEQTQTSHA